MLEWLLASIDPSRPHDVGVYLSWHARLMVLAWAVLMPVGIVAARYFKILPNQDWPRVVDNRAWWTAHRICQYSAAALTVVAVVLVRLVPEQTWASGFHYIFGWTIVTLASLQVFGGLLRGSKGGPTDRAMDGSLGGDHYDMTPRRIAFEYVHKTVGYMTVVLSVVAISTGLWQANAPRWMAIGILMWWAVLLFVAIYLQRRGMCVDTYQALWGPDKTHPGNQRENSIGLGVRSLLDDQDRDP